MLENAALTEEEDAGELDEHMGGDDDLEPEGDYGYEGGVP